MTPSHSISQQRQQPSIAPHMQPARPPPSKRPRWQRALLWGVALPISATISLGVIKGFVSPSDEDEQAQQAPEAVFAHVDGMWQAYEDNEVRADQIYKGKRVTIVGIVSDISSTIFDGAAVTLRGDVGRRHVRATMRDSAKDEVAKLNKGQQITLQCTGRGKVLGEPQLGNCTVR
jgi:hypothetical protein